MLIILAASLIKITQPGNLFAVYTPVSYTHLGMEHKIPVCVGAEQPLNGDEVDFPEFIHGKNAI